MKKEILCLKKSEYKTKDNRVVYRLHLWIDDGAVEYCVTSVDSDIYDYVEVGATFEAQYELAVFNSKIYGIKNLKLV